MGFAKRLKRAFGFSDSEMEEEELEGIDARVTPLRDRRELPASAPDVVSGGGAECVPAGGRTPSDTPSDMVREGSGSIATSVAVDSTEQTPDPSAIFESVVKIFNESLPDFLRDSVDEQSQREYLYRALDSSLKEYISNLSEQAVRNCDRRYEEERRSMQAEMDSLRKKMQQEETDSSESKKLQLSAERQKRALNERLHDMEKQLATLQAENEQYVLENKSLLNKLRITSVTGCGADADDALVEKLTELTDQLENVTAELTAQKELTAKAERESKENLMALDMNRRKLSEATEAWQRDTSELEKLRSEHGVLLMEHAALKEELSEANDSLKVVEELNGHLEQLENARKQNESVQRQQKDELLAQSETISRLEKEKEEYAATMAAKENSIRSLEDLTDSLRKTIENNLYEHAQTESVLRSEIERLKLANPAERRKSEPYSAPATQGITFAAEPEHADEEGPVIISGPSASDAPEGEVKRKKRGRKPKVKISAIDESIENTDWLLSTPPVKKKAAEKMVDNEFGYKEPDRKITPDHPAQMSLF